MLMIKRLMTKYVPGMLTCQEVDSFLYDFHQGNLPFGQELKFKMHIAMCSECKAYLNDYKDAIRRSKKDFILDDEIVISSVEKVPEDLMKAILKTRKFTKSTAITKKNTRIK